MEWVETTAKTLEAAKELALDRLGVAADEAEFEVLEEPRPGLFGRTRGEARVRARVMPAAVRPKQERRQRKGRDGRKGRGGQRESSANSSTQPNSDRDLGGRTVEAGDPQGSNGGSEARTAGEQRRKRPKSNQSKHEQKEQQVSTDGAESQESPVSPSEVGDAAVAFMSGLAAAFGADAETTVAIEGSEIDVKVTGSELGLLVGHGGRTLTAVQDLARVASQRRLGDHETRLRIDVAGYREKRRIALERFARAVADEVIAAGEAKALEPMQSADRKIVHDVLNTVEGVSSRSEGDEPRRRVVIAPN